MLHLSDLISEGTLAGRRVLIRADLNVPINEQGEIAEDTRLRASLPGIQAALQAGAAVMVTSHLGRPTEGALQAKDSLAPVAQRLSELLGRPVPLQTHWIEHPFSIRPGEITLLENCRANLGEKKDDETLARKMAQLCDIYVNDAFGTAHRAQASTHGIARYAPIACAGPLLVAELQALSKALDHPAPPLVAIVGGSKVSSKLCILHSLAHKVDRLIVGGGIANTFMLAAGLKIGQSLAEPEQIDEAKDIIDLMQKRGASVPLPVDVVTAKTFHAQAQATIKTVDAVEDDDLILDIGPQTAAMLTDPLKTAGTIIWNGPVGVFEWPQFGEGTQCLAHAIAQSPAFSIAGGGDTLAAIARYAVTDSINYISTGGGAFLAFLEGSPLPAVEVLEKHAKNKA